jgi:hypothetical protein
MVKRQKKRGGGSASSYVQGVAGDLNQQWKNTFDQNKFPANQGNGLTLSNGMTVNRKFSGGKKKTKKRGGNILGVINQAIVPFGILGVQQTFRKKKHHYSTFKRNRRHY